MQPNAQSESALAKAGLRAVHGDAPVPSTLEAAGALRADVLVACTQSDEDNLVISLLAKKRFNVPRVIARVNDELFTHSWGVDALVSPATALASMIRQESWHPAAVPSSPEAHRADSPC